MRLMGLHDHFRPPLADQRQWHGFHHAWATLISLQLNERLPRGYFAEPNVQYGIEIDVATMEDRTAVSTAQHESDAALEWAAWRPSAPTDVLPLPLVTDVVEALVYSGSGGPVLAAAIELVSPSNKDRPSHRDAFVAKCQAYVQQGLGLLVVDIVTERSANLHRELLARLGQPASPTRRIDLYAAAYRPVELTGEPTLNIWAEPLVLGRPLPRMPLWLPGDLCVPVDLNESYDKAFRSLRMPDVST